LSTGGMILAAEIPGTRTTTSASATVFTQVAREKAWDWTLAPRWVAGNWPPELGRVQETILKGGEDVCYVWGRRSLHEI